jgi:hypothetical protein
MNLIEKYGPVAQSLSISQYCPPRCFELAGKRFEFVMDTGEDAGDAVLDFVSETEVEWSIRGGAPKTDTYECRKADDWTYLVTYCLAGRTPRENHTWVIDREQGLMTFLRCALGENAYWPYLIDSHFTFGYIKEEDKEHTDRRRHGFTEDVVGTGVKWTYGHEMATVHIYHSASWYRITYPKSGAESGAEVPDSVSAIREIMKQMPGSDEPAYYVKIKEGMYLVSVTEQNMEKILGDKVGFRSDTLCFLDNWKHLYSVGRGFGTMTRDGQDSEIYVMIGKYGAPEDIDGHFFTDPNPYLI